MRKGIIAVIAASVLVALLTFITFSNVFSVNKSKILSESVTETHIQQKQIEKEEPPFSIRNDKHLCVVILNPAGMTCEKESILRLVSSGMFTRRVWYRLGPSLDADPKEMLCHSLEETDILKETNYLIVHQFMTHQKVVNFKENVLKKLGILYSNTVVVQYMLSDEWVTATVPDRYKNFDATFRNYWGNSITQLNSTMKNIYHVPLFTCYPYLSISPYPILPPSVVNNRKILDQIAEYQYSKLIPASKRKRFCFFKGQKRARSGDAIKVMNDLRADNDPNTQICSVEFTSGFDQGNKIDYSFNLMDSAIVLCPSGQNPDQFRVWESLDNGAIPIPEDLDAFSGLNHSPLAVIDSSKIPYPNHPDLRNMILRFYKNKQELDKYQKELYKWWFYKKIELGSKLSDVLN